MMSKRAKRIAVTLPPARELTASVTIQTLAHVLTVLDMTSGIYGSDRERILRQVAFYYGYELVKRT